MEDTEAEDHANADFIGGAPDDIRFLLSLIDRLTAANAALQAKVDAQTPKPVNDDIQHVICQHLDSANQFSCLSPVADGDKMYCEQHASPAPNGGETATDLPVYDTGIDAFNRGETAALVDTLKDARNALLSALAIPSELLPDVPHMGMKGMGFQIPPQPAPPATPRKLSSVKLTAAQVKVLKILDNHATYDFIPKFRFHGNGSTFKGLEKRGWITRNDEGLCHITPAGRAALASESEAGKK